MDYWPALPPVSQLPLPYRAWAWWLRHGPPRRQGVLGGSALFRALARGYGISSRNTLHTLTAPSLPALTIDLLDFETFPHTLPVWYRGDALLAVIQAATTDGG